jgi:hypothetical protein
LGPARLRRARTGRGPRLGVRRRAERGSQAQARERWLAGRAARRGQSPSGAGRSRASARARATAGARGRAGDAALAAPAGPGRAALAPEQGGRPREQAARQVLGGPRQTQAQGATGPKQMSRRWLRRSASVGRLAEQSECGLAGVGLGSTALGGRNMGARLGRHEANARAEVS